MASRCKKCGYSNDAYSTNCAKCGNSLSDNLQNFKSGLDNIRKFSILYLVSSLIGTADFIFGFIGTKQVLIWVYSSFSLLTIDDIKGALSSHLYIYQLFIAVSLIIALFAVYFLRKGYRHFEKNEPALGRSVKATHIVYGGLAVMIVSEIVMAGIIIAMIPGINLVPPAYSTTELNLILSFSIAASIGGSLGFIGFLLGIHIGLHRVSWSMGEGRYGILNLFYIVSLAVPPAGLIASYLTYYSTGIMVQKLNNSLGRIR